MVEGAGEGGSGGDPDILRLYPKLFVSHSEVGFVVRAGSN